MKFMSLFVLLLAPLLSSCSALLSANLCAQNAERIYDKDNTFQLKAGIYYDSEKTNHALSLFEEMWVDYYGNDRDVEHMVNNMCVIWEPYPFEAEGLPKTEDGLPGRANGLTVSVSRVRVSILENRKLSSTALIHELVHVMLWRINGEPDPDHERDAYKGWTEGHNSFIKDVKNILKSELGESD